MLIYHNPLAAPEDVADFIMEGQAAVTFPLGRMRLENLLDPGEGQRSNFVYWCPVEFPSQIAIEWEFRPIREPGLCMMFFAAAGRDGRSMFDPELLPRTGEYAGYHHGEIDTMHLSYFRRRYPEERAFHTVNLRKSYGFHLVAQGADPIPDADDTDRFYKLRLTSKDGRITFAVDNLTVLEWQDDGAAFGPLLGAGRIGFRQMSPLIAEYAHLRVYDLTDM
ncbi:DUF1961 family protein [Paenibacillus sp. strain BS8-2]